MNRTRIIYFLLPVLLVGLTLLLEYLTDGGMTLSVNASLLYVLRVIIILFSLTAIVGAFTKFRKDRVRLLAGLGTSAFLVVVDYYLNFDNPGSSNLLWLLPMLAVVYVLKYNAITCSSRPEEGPEEV